MSTGTKAEEKVGMVINFFVCNIDARCASCESRHIDQYGNQPLALCESPTKTQAVGKNMMRVFKRECSYRSVLGVNIPNMLNATNEKDAMVEPLETIPPEIDGGAA